MRRFCFVWCCLALGMGAVVGCKDKPKGQAKEEVSKIARAEAANLSSEADFALQMKDYARAEKALARATELDPQILMYSLNLGVSRRKLGQIDGARTAYQKALTICEEEHRKNPKDAGVILAQIRVLVLMNRADEARKFLDKARAELPNDRDVQSFWQSKVLDQMLADPVLKPFIL